MSAIVTATAAIAGKKIFESLVLDLYEYCKAQTGVAFKQWSTLKQVDKLHRRISQVGMVKTIWQVDKAVDLAGFYCHSHVVINGKRQRIETLSDFGIKDNLLIQGIAGQGKSIF
jgi:hypothetical protein